MRPPSSSPIAPRHSRCKPAGWHLLPPSLPPIPSSSLPPPSLALTPILASHSQALIRLPFYTPTQVERIGRALGSAALLLQFDNSLPHLASFYDAIGLGAISILDPDKKVTLKTVTFPAGRPEVRQTLLVDDPAARAQLTTLPQTHTAASLIVDRGLYLSQGEHARTLTAGEAIVDYSSGANHIRGAEAIERADPEGLESGEPMQHAVRVGHALLLDARESKAGSANSGGHYSGERVYATNNAELCVHAETGSAFLRVRDGSKIRARPPCQQ